MEKDNNPWKGFFVGMLGGIFGLLAMRFYWQKVAPSVVHAAEQRNILTGTSEKSETFDDVSIFGPLYQENETASRALGRRIFRLFTGREPRANETKMMLGELLHWDYCMFNGAFYGAMQGRTRGLDLKGGLLYGFVLWLFRDEAIIPLLGLKPGPTASRPVDHLNRLGAHLFYGGATTISTQLFFRVL
jgi:hypothetical protein